MVNIVRREPDEAAAATLAASGLSPLLAQLLAARGVKTLVQLEASLAGLIPPDRLTNNTRMAALLADAIVAKRSLLVVGDYDADGATATAVMVRGLRMLGAVVDFLVPNRFEYGYGLTPEIVELAAQSKPDFIITVDNGIASVDGVARANALGMSVLVTDHHLPGDHVPAAACIVNPNQHGCDFPSKHLAGVGVAFYVMLALRAEMRARGLFEGKAEPNLTSLLDLVALGTVADLVKLDDNNRILVEQGLRRIRAGQCSPGILWLMRLAGREPASSCAQDLGFSVGPRLNAAGRLDDMTLGISCLLAEDDQSAHAMAQQLHALNHERRSIEADMQESALAELDGLDAEGRYSLSLYQPDWHQGVIGILASRIKERYHRPVIAFAQAGDGVLKGSGRSIPGLHLRDALDLLSKREPDLILKFGGHAMAAGLSIREEDMERFRLGFESVVTGLLTPADLESIIEVDGALTLDDMHWDVAVALQRQVWGQGFPPPMFCDDFEVVAQRIVGGKHLKLTLSTRGRAVDAIFFRQEEFLPQYVTAVYELQTNAFNGARNVQLLIKHWQPVAAQSN
ncbi:single-stranded-DNA-specific exonuclease RecJ [Methylovorus glucosotrophus]|uniref:Single-stranded-DNA-specific exonuclease RecJ n=1 Tax=Methylovorus glucosotrophus (strain SIP3-4) TaxID=582744 RepID=C6XAI4_METGS|nr:single-stranded-DNA-specific exonuclease RecJ [Methylovorus glucosotrophus]ACT49916.1 single-stranded-DNA-specific exonuclease RecJ [Methylovorus glucosotrophus SIP3-4]